MWSTIALTSLRRAAHLRAAAPIPSRHCVTATITRASRFFSDGPFAVDSPDGNHDLQDIEECAEWAKRVIDVASVTEDADSITEMHRAVFEKQPFAVDSPDGEHDLEDVEEHLDAVNRIINSSSVLEDPEEIKKAHLLEEEIRMQTLEQTFVNAKY